VVRTYCPRDESGAFVISNSNAGWGWRRARACNNGHDTCVEVAFHEDVISVRNSQEAALVVVFTALEWRAFLEGVRAGEFDIPPDGSAT
jgi:Domain of unknown function (DUF397)